VAIGVLLTGVPVVLLRDDRGILALLDTRSWLAILAVMVVSPVVGWLFAGRHDAERRTFAIGANCRELALALTMASFAFPDKGVHTALYGIWSMLGIASFLLASGMRTYGKGSRPAVPQVVASGGRSRAWVEWVTRHGERTARVRER
jgi:hypothetical protein